LDYWEKVNLVHHPHWEGFLESIPKEAPIFLFSKFATQSFWQANYTPDCYLIFGCETKGLPSWIREKHADRLYGIPMQPDSVRSLNLSTAAGVVLYEALRQIKAFQ
jgi:tRNA (cytidine/uridine-2'-O-)-methyltransferase